MRTKKTQNQDSKLALKPSLIQEKTKTNPDLAHGNKPEISI